MNQLDAFMADHAARPWQWGCVDCSLVLADWVIANERPDPAPQWRGAYASEAEWRAIVAAHGGLLGVVRPVCEAAGLAALAFPVRGAVGVVGAARRIERQFGAIHDGHRWQIRMPDGFVAVVARPLAIWGV